MSKLTKEEIEQKRDVLDSIKAREIVHEILNFGVNEFQKKKIIKLLALELEDREVMVKICEIFSENEEDTSTNKIEI
jgi:hypothetical protein